jgi:hypothetical protein
MRPLPRDLEGQAAQLLLLPNPIGAPIELLGRSYLRAVE